MTETSTGKQRKADRSARLSTTLAIVWGALVLLLILAFAGGSPGIDVDVPKIITDSILLMFFGLPIIGFLLSIISLILKKNRRAFIALTIHSLVIVFILILLKMFIDSFCVIC